MTFRSAAGIALAIASLYACGETLANPSDDPADGGAGDGARSDDAQGDAVGDGNLAESSIPVGDECDRARSFGTPVDVVVSGAYSIEAARFNANRTLAYLALCPTDGNKAQCDLFQSPYTGTGFGSHTPLGNVNATGFYDSYPTVTLNDELLVFGSTRGGGVKIFVANAVNASFAASVGRLQQFAPAIVNTNEPYVLGSGKALWFGGANTADDWDIYRATGWGADAAAPAQKIGELSTPQNDQAPVVTEDEREIFFASDRNANGMQLDIHRAFRSDPGAPFGAPEHLTALSTSGNDWPVWISPDRCDLYFINKDLGSGLATLRVASRR